MRRTQNASLRRHDHGRQPEARSWTCILLRHSGVCNLVQMESIATIRRGKLGLRFCVRMEQYLPPGLTAAQEAGRDTRRFTTPRLGSGQLVRTFQMRITRGTASRYCCRMAMCSSKVECDLICGTEPALPKRWPRLAVS